MPDAEVIDLAETLKNEVAEGVDPTPEYVLTGSPSTPSSPVETTATVAADDDDDEEFGGRGRRKGFKWRSGWCGPGPECHDGTGLGMRAESEARCKGLANNGANAPVKQLWCACVCHEEQRAEHRAATLASERNEV